MPFDFLQMLLPQQLHIPGSHIAALCRNGVEKALFFQLLVSPLGGNKADAQVFGKPPDGGKHLVFRQRAADDLLLDLGVDLIIDGRAAFVVNQNIHVITSVYAEYIQYLQICQ